MKKKFALLLSLLSVMAVSSIGLASCGKKGGDNAGSSSQPVPSETSSSEAETSSSSSAEVLVPSLTLNETALTMGQYESETLTATLANADGEVVWASSNESVAKVVDGVVTGYTVGEAVITATVGDLTATCTVTVTESTVAFTGLDDEMEIIKGIYEDLDLTVECNGEEMTGVTVSVATEGANVTVEEDEGAYALFGANYGAQTVTVTAQWNGITVAEKTIAVNVVEYAALIVDLPENKLDLLVGAEGYDLSEITVILNDVEVESPVLSGVSSAEGVAKVQDGKIVPVGAGTAQITVSYTTDQDTYDTIITVTVTKKVTNKEVNFFVQGDAGKTSANTGNVTVDLSATDIDLSTVTAVYCGEQAVTYSVDGTNLKMTDAPGGYQIYTLETAMEDFTIDGCVYSHSVSTAEELLDWRKNCGTYKGYTVLTADIDMGGITLDGQPNAYGVLDGRGHTISNFIYTHNVGFVRYLSAGSAVKNIQFVNIVQDCTNATSSVTMGLFGDNLMSSIENVLIKVQIKNLAETLEHYGVTVHYSSAGSVAKNIVLHATTVGSTPKYLYGHSSGGADDVEVDNVHFVVSGVSGTASGRKATNSGMYETEAAMSETVDFTMWNGWSETAEGAPYMSDYTDDMATPAVIAKGEARKGKTISFTDTSFVPLTYTLEGDVAGVTIEGSTVTIGADAAIGSTFKVVVSSSINPEFSEEFEYTIVKEKVAIEGEYLVKGSSTNKWSYKTGDAAIDLSAVENLDLSKVTKVVCDNAEVTYKTEGSTLTLTDAPGGLHEYTLYTEESDYLLNVCVYVLGISTKDELEEWRTTESYWYAVLLNDIDYENATLAVGANVLGTLDGRGYTIKNFTYSQGFVKSMYAAESAIKNVKFENATQDCTGMGSYPAFGLFGQWTKGTIENIYLDITTTNMDASAEHIATICYGVENGTLKNIVLDLKNENGNFHYGLNQNTGGTVVGVVASYAGAKGASQGGGAGWGVADGFHQRLDWMVAEEAKDELLTFTSPYWQIDAEARTIDLKPVASATADAE